MGFRADQNIDELIESKLLSGEADTVADAEEQVLNDSWDAVLELAAGPLSNRELGDHPLFRLFRIRGSRPREDDAL